MYMTTQSAPKTSQPRAIEINILLWSLLTVYKGLILMLCHKIRIIGLAKRLDIFSYVLYGLYRSIHKIKYIKYI